MKGKFLLFILATLLGLDSASMAKNPQDISPASAQQFCNKKEPFSFMENKGQIIDQNQHSNVSVLYQLSLPGMNVSLKKNGFSYDVWMAEDLGEDQEIKSMHVFDSRPTPHKYSYKFHRVDIDFLDANTRCKIEAEGKAPDYTMYYTVGTQENGVIVYHYEKVVYRNLYPGIDLEFVAAPGSSKPIEYNFIVHPGADVAQIKMRYTGALNSSLKNGALVMQLAHTELSESIPASWTKENGEQVQVCYLQLAQDKNSITLGFTTKDLTKNNTLIIDPTPNLVWGTYYGGSSYEEGLGIATDALGNVLVTGSTSSVINIATSGANQIFLAGGDDTYVLKLNSSGVRQWSTYYGGTNDDIAQSITTDISGNLLVTGWTSSNTGIASSGAHQIIFGGINDAFVVKFNSSGVLQWSTYYGGTDFDYGFSIASDTSGNVLVTGRTLSTTGIASAGAHQTTLGGSGDAYIVKFNSMGVRQWGTYYGGLDNDNGEGIAVDTYGNVLVTGASRSINDIATLGAHQTILGGNFDAFIVKFNSSGTRQWGTYYGGAANDYSYGITTDASDNILVIGVTNSTSGIAISGVHQTILAGNYDAFIVKLFASGLRYWGTYYGGTENDYGNRISTDSFGNVYVAGTTASTSGIATAGSCQAVYLGGNSDAFIVKFNAWSVRQWGTYFGGTDQDNGNDIAVNSSGNVLITGSTSSTNYIVTTGAHQATLGGPRDAFIAKFSSTNVGINDIANDLLFTLYPNPTERIVNVKTDAKLIDSVYIVYDNTGKSVLNGIITTEITSIDLGNLLEGVYLVKIGKKIIHSFKVIKD